ncbi:hypothetical protein [Brochothrix thermosphacta]|uniref:Uncharacterized protein n=1 Tax=Brochothrix thermosphacta TaxID=2756 RepID=A0A1D2KDZ3_BROTH|nr:hypothetical protein [Brochothrix thermosphacta]ATF25140.1 hypothetical protein CNY62_01390 [Brochothrix thermosphacta]ATH84523.1 hypothetical protein CPF12_01220 [Brochothrix thermosphacta]MPQ27571.1 hypothetical protein [Brochothrix thermosphacta]ODJ55844.1 hypothetical protein BFR38_07640 [Brochothrix thermosphacta]ODJ60825.1 hypothetical protein BFR42_02600 [Brochothrix thermosphacta]
MRYLAQITWWNGVMTQRDQITVWGFTEKHAQRRALYRFYQKRAATEQYVLLNNRTMSLQIRRMGL